MAREANKGAANYYVAHKLSKVSTVCFTLKTLEVHNDYRHSPGAWLMQPPTSSLPSKRASQLGGGGRGRASELADDMIFAGLLWALMMRHE